MRHTPETGRKWVFPPSCPIAPTGTKEPLTENEPISGPNLIAASEGRERELAGNQRRDGLEMAGRIGDDRFNQDDSPKIAEEPRGRVVGGKRKEGKQPDLNRG